MANITINNPTELAVAPAADDFIPIWDTSAGQHKKIKPGNLVGLSITGGGVVATGGFVLTVPKTGTAVVGAGTAGRIAEWVTDANTLQASTLAKSGAGILTLASSGAFTLTVPETLTAAGRNVANTYTALQTFSAGINLGNTNLANYLENTWTPEVQGSVSNPTVTYGARTGTYTRIGNVIFYSFRIPMTTISGGSGNLLVTLPSVPVGTGTPAALRASNVNFTGTPASVIFVSSVGGSNGSVYTIADNGAETLEAVGILTNGSVLQASGFYFAS